MKETKIAKQSNREYEIFLYFLLSMGSYMFGLREGYLRVDYIDSNVGILGIVLMGITLLILIMNKATWRLRK